MVKQRQILGILGMALAVGGGIVWFYGQHIPAFLLWGGAVMVLLRLNKKGGRRRKS